jgi:hypothetical protein
MWETKASGSRSEASVRVNAPGLITSLKPPKSNDMELNTAA